MVVPLPLMLLLLVTLLLLLAVVLITLLLLALVLVLPRIRHAGGWNLALPRGQPRGRLGFYVAQRPATREAGT